MAVKNRGELVVQSISDRLDALIIETERYSNELWNEGDRAHATDLEQLAHMLVTARETTCR